MKADGRHTKGEKTKQWVIERSAEIFNTKGYHGTSINDLREATKLTSGVIYGNFQGKQDLATKAFEYNIQKLHTLYLSAVLSKDKPDEQLFAFVEHPYKIVHKIFQGGCPVLNMSTEADDALPWIKTKVLYAIKRMIGLVENILTDGIEKGIFRQVDIAEVSRFIFASIEGGIMLAKSNNEIEYMKQIENQLKAYIINVLLIE
ncbi:MAG: TetR family transcriptional regulator [Bacteroidota bacterium]